MKSSQIPTDFFGKCLVHTKHTGYLKLFLFKGAPVATSEPGYGLAKVIVDDYMKNLCSRAPASEAQAAPSASTHAGPAPSSSSGSEAAEEDREEEGGRAASYSPAWHGFYTGIPSQIRTKLSNDGIVQANVIFSLNCSLMTRVLYTGSTIFSLQFVYKLLNACVTSSSTFRKELYIKDLRKNFDILNPLPYSFHFAQIVNSKSMRLSLLCLFLSYLSNIPILTRTSIMYFPQDGRRTSRLWRSLCSTLYISYEII